MFKVNGDKITVEAMNGDWVVITLEQEEKIREAYVSEKKSMREVAGVVDLPYNDFLTVKRGLGLTRKSSPLSIRQLSAMHEDDMTDEEILSWSIEQHYEALERSFYKKKDKLTETTLKNLVHDRSYESAIAEKIASRERFTIEGLSSLRVVPKTSRGTMVIPLADWHYGMSVDTAVNIMNIDIMKANIKRVTQETIRLVLKEQPEEIYIMNLGDLIHGIIHTSTRFDSVIDVVDQVTDVASMVSEFINALANVYGGKIVYCDVFGNHGRVTPDITSHRTGENFERLVSKFVRLMIDVDVEYDSYEVTELIKQTITSNGAITYTHAANRNMARAIKDLALLTNVRPNLILAGHYHSDTFREEQKNIKMIVTPSLCGADSYAQKLTFIGKPQQTFLFLKDGELASQHFYTL